MNRRSYGYLVRALNEFASLAARCGSKDLHHPVPAKVPIRMDGLSRKSRAFCRRSARITRHVMQNEQLSHCRKKYQ
jgi:hypothetical protein